MTLPRLSDMTNYWKKNPPLHLMVAAYFGVGGKPEAEKNHEKQLGDLLAKIPMVARDAPK